MLPFQFYLFQRLCMTVRSLSTLRWPRIAANASCPFDAKVAAARLRKASSLVNGPSTLDRSNFAVKSGKPGDFDARLCHRCGRNRTYKSFRDRVPVFGHRGLSLQKLILLGRPFHHLSPFVFPASVILERLGSFKFSPAASRSVSGSSTDGRYPGGRVSSGPSQRGDWSVVPAGPAFGVSCFIAFPPNSVSTPIY